MEHGGAADFDEDEQEHLNVSDSELKEQDESSDSADTYEEEQEDGASDDGSWDSEDREGDPLEFRPDIFVERSDHSDALAGNSKNGKKFRQAMKNRSLQRSASHPYYI